MVLPTTEADTGWPPQRLTVIYDDECELCWRCANWLSTQPTHVDLQFLAASDPAVFDRYGDLPWYRIELMVTTDTGQAWVGGDAFVMCLWATLRWHRFAFQLRGKALAPLAERFFHALSANRSVVSGLLTPTRCRDGACSHHRSMGAPRHPTEAPQLPQLPDPAEVTR